MWTVVQQRQQPSRRRREANAAKSAGSGKGVSSLVTTIPSRSTAAEVKHLRKAARFLRGLAFVRRDVISPLRHFLNAHSNGLTGIKLVALGIGPFTYEESRAGFLQMALFIVLQSECESFVRHLIRSKLSSVPSNNGYGLQPSTPTVRACFFDPVATEVHTKCCDKLGVMMEECNLYGAYIPSHPHALLIAYLPHSPWVLLRNLFVSNLTKISELPTGGEGGVNKVDSLVLRRTLVIGNDVKKGPCVSDTFLEKLGAFLHIGELHVRGRRKQCVESFVECVSDTCDDVGDVGEVTVFDGLTGISRHDIVQAFSETSVMQLNERSELLLLDELKRIRIPPLTCVGLDMV
ncbi:hypothetical protein, conserved [Trypanosoma brucei gambiense DAL972]|uniref:SRR1-like domain-containing protein n=1 Tax=Trypanosoma brucei gambiense (strain MHOM/CI/86/DAL972) TaxID=679716 RepID=D0AA97_TRYB9|nr:hypothetical protein, conserved [Trypanosoma brucei gambiense DAL972]CBH18598.1 hypothetical protein, conserved [Trypanosoma brucei gambiense DAL972]|eukprot:XP_011780862.1 hypothetical protein, conserved [Trypanosoma brucei gambiense DAL972]